VKTDSERGSNESDRPSERREYSRGRTAENAIWEVSKICTNKEREEDKKIGVSVA
jgi:hypothetical protein